MTEKSPALIESNIEALFRSEKILDEGFSEKTISRIRKQLLLRRLIFLLAFLAGASVAVNPLIDLINRFTNFTLSSLGNLDSNGIAVLTDTPLPPVILMGAALLFAMTGIVKLLEQ